jgi:hypothetical protein
MLLVLLFCGAALAQTPPPIPPVVLPGVDLVGQSFDILMATRDGIDIAKGSVFQFQGTMNQSTSAGLAYPYGVKVGGDTMCSSDIESKTYSTTSEYQTDTTSTVTVSAEYLKFTGSYTETQTAARDELSTQSSVLNVARTKCTQYTLTLHPFFVEHDPIFVSEVKKLPVIYDSSTAPAWQAFLNLWNPHVAVACTIGGVMDMVSFTSKEYLKDHTVDTASQEAKAKLIVSIDEASKSTTTVDKTFEDDTTASKVTVHGGTMQDGSQWVAWADSVQQGANPACLDVHTEGLSTIIGPDWTSDPELNARAAAMESASAAYFDRPGCTDPNADNFDNRALVDNGSCNVTKPYGNPYKQACLPSEAKMSGTSQDERAICSPACTVDSDCPSSTSGTGTAMCVMNLPTGTWGEQVNCIIACNYDTQCPPSAICGLGSYSNAAGEVWGCVYSGHTS